MTLYEWNIPLTSNAYVAYYLCTYVYIIAKGTPLLIVGIAVGIAHDEYGNED